MFWKDLWLDLEPAQSYPRAYSFAKKEDISVQEFLSSGDLATLFHLPLSPQAMDELRDLQLATRHISMTNTTDGDDWTFAWDLRFMLPVNTTDFAFRILFPMRPFFGSGSPNPPPSSNSFAGSCWLIV